MFILLTLAPSAFGEEAKSIFDENWKPPAQPDVVKPSENGSGPVKIVKPTSSGDVSANPSALPTHLPISKMAAPDTARQAETTKLVKQVTE